MKNIILALTTLLSAQTFAADVKQVIVSQKTVDVPITINSTLLKLSQADYSIPTVKILVPALADITVMNHRNSREGAPCLATDATKEPNDIIQNRDEVTTVPMTITLTKLLYVDSVTNKCQVVLTESVTTQIRGFAFYHDRSQAMPSRHIDDCR